MTQDDVESGATMSSGKRSLALPVVAGVFTLAGGGMLIGALHFMAASRAPRTGPVAVLAFGWVVLAMAVSIVTGGLLPSSRTVSSHASARRGIVTIE